MFSIQLRRRGRAPCPVSKDLADHLGDSARQAERAISLEQLQAEERASTTMPEDLMQLVGEHMSPSPYELIVWGAHLSKDDAKVGRIVRGFIETVHREAADKRAAARLTELEKEQM